MVSDAHIPRLLVGIDKTHTGMVAILKRVTGPVAIDSGLLSAGGLEPQGSMLVNGRAPKRFVLKPRRQGIVHEAAVREAVNLRAVSSPEAGNIPEQQGIVDLGLRRRNVNELSNFLIPLQNPVIRKNPHISCLVHG